jgi:hypothetical protein
MPVIPKARHRAGLFSFLHRMPCQRLAGVKSPNGVYRESRHAGFFAGSLTSSGCRSVNCRFHTAKQFTLPQINVGWQYLLYALA